MGTPIEIAKARQLHSNLFGVTIAGEDYVFRCLRLGEYKIYDAILAYDESEAEDFLIRKVLVKPSKINEKKILAGVITNLVQSIIDTSGFQDDYSVPSILHTKRLDLVGGQREDGTERAPVADMMMTAVICKAFRVPPSFVLDLDVHDLCYHLAIAEHITGDLVEALTPEEKAKRAKAAEGETADKILQDTLRNKGRVDFGRENKGIDKMAND